MRYCGCQNEGKGRDFWQTNSLGDLEHKNTCSERLRDAKSLQNIWVHTEYSDLFVNTDI